MSKAGKLDKQNVEDIWPLTPVQEGMLFHYLSQPDSQEYFQQIRLAVTGELHDRVFEQAWQEVVAQNELLRTVFRFENVEKPLQIVLKQHAVPIRWYDFTQVAEAERQEKLDEAAANDAAEPLDLTASPFRITVCRLSLTECELIISSHHILYDGWSNGILLREFSDKYKYLLINERKTPVRLQKTKYKEWIKWQLQQDKGVQQNYWQSYLRGFDTKTELPVDHRHPTLAHKTVDRFFSLSEELTAAIKRFVRVQNLTLSTLFHTAWGILLQKYNNSDDVVFGTTVSGRSANLKGIEEIVGLFINTIPLRLVQKPGQTIAELLRQTGQRLRDHQEFEHTPLVDIKSWSAADRKESLFDSIVVIQNYPLDMGVNHEQNLLQVTFKSTLEKTNYDMVLVVNDFAQPDVYLSYNAELFEEATIARLAGHLICLIEAIIEQPERSVADLDMLTAEEKRQLLVEFNRTAVDFACDKLVHQRIEEQAERTPDAIAVVDGERTWTYQVLNERANQLASFLREEGIGREGLVPILGERSAELVAGMLAVFKSGGAYVPLDVHYPVERLLGIFQEIGSTVLLTTSTYELSDELIDAICAGTKIRTLVYMDQHGDLERANERLQRAARSVEQDVERLETFLRERAGMLAGPVGVAFTTRRQQLVAEAALARLGAQALGIDPLAARREKHRLLQEAGIGTVLTESRHFDEWDAVLWESDTLQLLIQLDPAETEQAEGKEANLKHLWNFVAETSTTAVNDYGWTSSYTGEPFSPEEMNEYILNFKQKLQPYLKPDARVLEIGCGHGLVMFEIAPQVGQYVATDLSGVIIEKNRARLQEAGLTHVELYELAAREIGQVPERGYDAVISSSVVHFFPNTLYLEEVIGQSIELLGDEGIIYLDDMMDVGKKAELVASMRDYKEQHPAAKVKTDWDGDLFVPEQLFHDLQVRFPEIVAIESTRKTGVIENELTRFRYDVVLKIDKRNPLPDVAGERKKQRYTGEDLLRVPESSARRHKTETELAAKQEADSRLTGAVLEADVPANLQAVDSRSLAGQPTGNPTCLNEPQDLCYVIYTSGSTGKPKGVMIEHIGMTNHMLAKIADFAIGEHSAVGQVASHCFDQSIWQFFAPLMAGGRTVLYANAVQLDLDVFIARLIKDEISVLQVVPVYLALLADAIENDPRSLPQLQVLGTSGEALKPQLVSKWFSLFPETRLINSYGATECSDDFTHFIMEQDPATNPVSIGTPVQNVVVYVLDKDMNLCPVGVKGEICASGISVGRGYLNNAEKTNAAFLRDPFAEEGVRLYRTGDRGRWLADGTLEFAERIDHQVKIRSYRVELGEIEAQLLRVPGIVEAVVLAKDDAAQNKFLCAYFVADGELSVAGVKEQLARELPEYMIPAHFLRLQQIPLTDNGKIDKKALPEPDSQAEATLGYAAPTTELETQLAAIWQDVLDVQDVGIHDHFFDLGGHSLKATMLIGRLNKTFQKQIPLRTIFEHPTIAELAAVIGGTENGSAAAIPPASKRDLYPASSAQQRMYVLHRLKENDLSYNITGVMDVSGPLDAARFEAAVQTLLSRQEALRTSFVMEGGELMQRVAEQPSFAVARFAANDDEVDAILHSFIQPFDLARGPLLRVGLISLAAERHVLVFDMHHIIADGVSMGVLVEEFAALYGGAKLPELTLHYKDYAVWQQERAASEAQRAQEAYWLNRLAGELPTLDVPTDAARPAVKSFSGGQVPFAVDAELTLKLRRLMAETDTTLFMVLLAVYSVWLAKYAGQEDVIVGTPVSGRGHADLEKMVGLFLNTLPLRSFPQPDKTFRGYLAEIKGLALEAFEHQAYPFEELVEKLALPRDLSRNPLFDAMLVLQPLDLAAIRAGDITFTPRETDLNRAKLDLTLHAVEQGGGIGLKLEYASDLFARETAERMAAHFLLLLQAAVNAPHAELAQLRMLSAEEEQRVLFNFNDTATPASAGAQTVAQRFEEQAGKTPERIAVVSAEETLTYGELNRRANQLARRLRERGASPGTFAAILVDRSAAMVTAILAVLKAGAAYVPIDPELPAERIAFTLADSGAAVLLTQQRLSAELDFAGDRLDLEDETLYQGDDSNLPLLNDPEDAVYAIYTSGTTGRPKGVVIEQHSLLNYADWFVQAGGVTEADKTALLASYSFDLGYTALYPALLSGAELHILAQERYADPAELLAYLNEQRITFIKATPTLFGMLVSAPGFAERAVHAALRLVVLGGERINMEDVRKFHRDVPAAQVMNHYGPTETTVGAVAQLIDRDEQSAFPVIGTPIHNVQVYLLDALGQPVPVGVRGELHIAGAGVARGYLNRPELEAEKFIPNSFGTGRLYKTGDLGRQLPDGRIQFLGRTDEQVKIRGYRVELAEIEKALLAQDGIREAAVTAQPNRHGGHDLCAYVTADSHLQLEELRARLARLLPTYMLPAYYARIDQLPVTPNGKLDKKALPTLPLQSGGADEAKQQAPETSLEQKLAAIWQEVLGIEKPGLDGDFFSMGGNSLKATVLTSRIYKELNAELSLRQVFQTPTIRGLAGQLQAAHSRFRPIQPAPKREHYPVSSAQKRLLIISQLDAEGLSYNMPGGFLLQGPLDRERFAEALQTLTARHETLRTSFGWVDGEPVQQIAPEVTLPLLYSEADGADETQIEAAARAFLRPFDLAQAPLMRAGLIKLAEQRHLFLYDMHHAITDGVSRRILVQELAALYAGETLPPMPIQFKEYVLWQQEMEASPERAGQERFWLEAFAGEVPVLQLPTDFPRPSVKTYQGARSFVQYDAALLSGLKRLAQESGATLFMVLLAAYQILLAKHAGQEDVVVGTPIAGRAHADADGLIGMFVNTLAMRGRPQAAKTIAGYLAEVKEMSLQSLEHGDYPFERLAGALDLRADRSRNPLFDAMFVWDNLGSQTLTMDALACTPYVLEDDTAKFDLTCYAEEHEAGLRVMFEYATGLFKPETIERLQADLETILQAMVQDRTQTIGGIELAAGYKTAANGLDDDADFLF